MMQRLMKPLAKKSDLEGIRCENMEVKESVKGIGVRQDKVENDLKSLREEFAQLKREVREDVPRQGRRSTGRASDASIAFRKAHGHRTWQPRLLHWRGWSPYGAGPGTKLTRSEAENLQQTLQALLPPHMASCIKLLTPFVKKHAVSAEVLS